jgi:hypothetical protein
MSIYIYNNQQTSGPFEENAVAAWLHAGQISPDALACPQGATQWRPIRELFPAPGQAAAFTGAQMPGAAPTAHSQAVVNWARQSFPARVEARLKFADVGRGELAKYLDADEVETRGGQRHRWETLQYISYLQEGTDGGLPNRRAGACADVSGSREAVGQAHVPDREGRRHASDAQHQ